MSDQTSSNFKAGRPRRGPGGGMHGGMVPGEKAKDFKGSFRKLSAYIGRYKIAIFIVMILAACSTVFSVLGPKTEKTVEPFWVPKLWEGRRRRFPKD